jgi:hypothetical protein
MEKKNERRKERRRKGGRNNDRDGMWLIKPKILII